MENMQERVGRETLPINAEVADLVREALAPEIEPFDPEEANAILEEASFGNPAAQYILGVALESVIPPRMSDAINWFQLAAEKNYRPAVAKLRTLRIN